MKEPSDALKKIGQNKAINGIHSKIKNVRKLKNRRSSKETCTLIGERYHATWLLYGNFGLSYILKPINISMNVIVRIWEKALDPCRDWLRGMIQKSTRETNKIQTVSLPQLPHSLHHCYSTGEELPMSILTWEIHKRGSTDGTKYAASKIGRTFT